MSMTEAERALLQRVFRKAAERRTIPHSYTSPDTSNGQLGNKGPMTGAEEALLRRAFSRAADLRRRSRSVVSLDASMSPEGAQV